MHFLLSSKSVVYVLTTLIPEDGGDNPTMEQDRRRVKWDNDDYVYKGLVLIGMSDSLFDVYQNVETSKELWDTLKAKYMAEDASGKKFLVINFINYKMTDSRPVLEQYNELFEIIRRVYNNDKPKGNNVAGPSVVNMVEHNNSSRTEVLELIHSDLYDLHAAPALGNKKYFVTFINDASRAVVRLPDLKLKTLDERGIECIFVRYTEHSKALGFYVIEPNNSVAINSIIESKDAIFDEHRFSSVPRPSQRSLKDGTRNSSGLVVFERVTKEAVQQPESELKKSKRHRTPKDFGPEFQLYLIKGKKDEISDQHSYCFNVEDDPKKFDEAMKSYDMDVKTTFLNEELEEEVYINNHLGFIMPVNENNVCKLIKSLYGLKKAPKQWIQKFDKVVLSNGYLLRQADKSVYSKLDKSEFFSSRFSIKDMEEADVILVSTPLDTCEKLMPNKGLAVSQLEYSRVIGCLMYAMTCTRPDIPFDVGKLSRDTSNPGTQHWQVIQRILKYLKKIIDSRMVYSGY
nr:zinc finger, CCHC-type [Tanacetum cinerariifolium]